MPWCPKCKSEYEEGVLSCVECKVELVEDLKKHVFYASLVKVEPSIVEGLLEYLNYSGISDHRINEGDQVTEILVNEKDLRKASKHLSVYLYNLQKEEIEKEEDTYEIEDLVHQDQKNNEEDVNSNITKLKDMRSSAFTYFALGFGLLIFDILNMVNLLNVISVLLEGILLMIGFVLIGLGKATLKKIPSLENKVNTISNNMEEMVNWYESRNNMKQFYEDNNIDISSYDEGALYFVAFEVIKAEIMKQFPEHEETLINNAVDEIYSKIQ